MKKLYIYICLIILICSSRVVVAEIVQSAAAPALQTTIKPIAIKDPLSLPVWYPVAPVDQIIINAGSSVFRFIVPFVIPLTSKVSNIIKGNPQSPPQSNIPINYDNQSYSPLMDHEEILYDIDFKNSKKTPIYSDTVISIIIPKGLRYISNSFQLNNTKVSDKEDNDELTYLLKESLLKIDLSKLNKKDQVKISFSAKILDKNKIENNPFCFIKFESNSNNITTDYIPLP